MLYAVNILQYRNNRTANKLILYTSTDTMHSTLTMSSLVSCMGLSAMSIEAWEEPIQTTL